MRRSVGSGIAPMTGEAGWKNSVPNAHAEIMNRPRHVASIRYSGQWKVRPGAVTLTLRETSGSSPASPRRILLLLSSATRLLDALDGDLHDRPVPGELLAEVANAWHDPRVRVEAGG